MVLHKSWDAYFRQVEAGAAPGTAYVSPPAISSTGTLTIPIAAAAPTAAAAGVALPAAASAKEIEDHLSVQTIIRAYQMRGHNIADLDPLGINSADLDNEIPPELILANYGLADADLDREFRLPGRCERLCVCARVLACARQVFMCVYVCIRACACACVRPAGVSFLS